MATATIGDIYKRLGVIKERLQTAAFEGGLLAEEQAALESEADAIWVILANAIAEKTGEDPKAIFEMRDKVRQLNLIAEMARRVKQTFPNNAVANQAVQDLEQGEISPEQLSIQLPIAFGVPPTPARETNCSLVGIFHKAWQGLKPK